MRSTSCRTSASCATRTTTPDPASWRRIFRWPLFSVLAVVHLVLLPMVLGDGGDQTIAMLGGVFYLVLAALDWRHRRTPASA
jgi:phosphatidylglycerophosphate synthase